MKANRFFDWLMSREGIYYVLLAFLLVVIFPLALDAFRLNMIGKYLTYAFAALGLVLCWGRSGILSLGQGIFFGLGGYCMAMFLKLEASSPENTAIQSTPGIPDFMDWNQLTALPWFWEPFHSFSFTLIAVVAVHVQAPGGWRVLRHHYPGYRCHPDYSDHRSAGLYRGR